MKSRSSLLIAVFVGCLFLCPSTMFAARSNCEGQHEAGKRKMQQEKEKNGQRQQENHPDQDELDSALEQCLGKIEDILGKGGGALPPIPSVDAIIDGICKEARQKINQTISSSGSYYNEGTRGNNFVRPSDGSLNLEI